MQNIVHFSSAVRRFIDPPQNLPSTVCYNLDIYQENVAVTAQKDVRTKVIAGAFPPAPCCQRVSDDICECVVEAEWRERESYGAR